jgi:hypothetical protein
LSGQLASPVWNLLGWKGQIIPDGTVFTSGPDESVGGTPPFNVAFIDGTVGWRRQIEGHTPVPNWPTFATFAARYLNDQRPVIAADQVFALGEGPMNIVGTVKATDEDADDRIGSWQVKGGSGASAFSVKADAGTITIDRPLQIDFRKSHYTLTLMAGDGKLPSADAEVTIQIPDRVNVCYGKAGRNLLVSKYSVPSHLRSGARIGRCS